MSHSDLNDTCFACGAEPLSTPGSRPYQNRAIARAGFWHVLCAECARALGEGRLPEERLASLVSAMFRPIEPPNEVPPVTRSNELHEIADRLIQQHGFASNDLSVARLRRIAEELDAKPEPGHSEEARAVDEGHADPWRHRSVAMSCATCMWYVRKEKSFPQPPSDRGVGRCRRHSPTMSGYPVVFSADWCGDHKLDENRA